MPEVEPAPAAGASRFIRQPGSRSAIESRCARASRRAVQASVATKPDARQGRAGDSEAAEAKKRAQLYSNPCGIVGRASRAGWFVSAPMRACEQGKKAWAQLAQLSPCDQAASGGRQPISRRATAAFITGCRSEPLHRPIPKCFASVMRAIGQKLPGRRFGGARGVAGMSDSGRPMTISCPGWRRSRTRTARAASRRGGCSSRCCSSCWPPRSSPGPCSGSGRQNPAR